MLRGFKYRFYPTQNQERSLACTFGSCRFVYNWGLRLRTDAWYGRKESISYAETSKLLTQLKRHPDTIWLNDVSSVTSQQSLRHLQTAFANFFARRSGYPNFRKKDGTQSAEYTRSAFSFAKGRLVLSKLGPIKIKWSRRFKNQPSTVTITKTPAGRYYVSFLVDDPLRPLRKGKADVGIDFGINAFATTSNGQKFIAPRPFKKGLRKLARAQKTLARKQKGSKNRKKAQIRTAKIHQTIADIRKDFVHKFTTKMIRDNQAIFVEDLDVREMMSKQNLAQSLGDSAIGMAIHFLEYKSRWHGRTFGKVDRFYPSSKRCRICGHIRSSLPLNIRNWTCEKCGSIHDRDENAAHNILAEGHSVTACGDHVRPARSQGRTGLRSVKQESRRR